MWIHTLKLHIQTFNSCMTKQRGGGKEEQSVGQTLCLKNSKPRLSALLCVRDSCLPPLRRAASLSSLGMDTLDVTCVSWNQKIKQEDPLQPTKSSVKVGESSAVGLVLQKIDVTKKLHPQDLPRGRSKQESCTAGSQGEKHRTWFKCRSQGISWKSEARRQEGRNTGQCVAMGKQEALQPGALPTGHPGTMLKGRSRHHHPAGSH